MIDEKTILDLAVRAVDLYMKMPPRPVQVTQSQAAKMLGLSRPTVSRMVKSGAIRLNRCGRISITEIDRVQATLRKP